MSHTRLYANPPGILSGEGDNIATIIGVPFDSTHSYRPGCRFAPDYIREMLNNIEVFHPDLGIDLEQYSISDMGNLAHTVDAQRMLYMTEKVTAELMTRDWPLILLGGEHLITLGSYMAYPENTALIILDAHYDLRDSYAGASLSHASFLRRIIERKGKSDDVIHLGGRAFVAEELAYVMENDVNVVTDSQIRQGMGVTRLQEFCNNHDSVYVSIDMDVLDPAYCPGVGNPEACGLTSTQVMEIVNAIPGSRIAGCDIVELNPTYDTGAGGAMAAKIISTIMAKHLSARGTHGTQ